LVTHQSLKKINQRWCGAVAIIHKSELLIYVTQPGKIGWLKSCSSSSI